MLMMTPPLLRYFWFHSIYSLAASCTLQSENVIHRRAFAAWLYYTITNRKHLTALLLEWNSISPRNYYKSVASSVYVLESHLTFHYGFFDFLALLSSNRLYVYFCIFNIILKSVKTPFLKFFIQGMQF